MENSLKLYTSFVNGVIAKTGKRTKQHYRIYRIKETRGNTSVIERTVNTNQGSPGGHGRPIEIKLTVTALEKQMCIFIHRFKRSLFKTYDIN